MGCNQSQQADDTAAVAAAPKRPQAPTSVEAKPNAPRSDNGVIDTPPISNGDLSGKDVNAKNSQVEKRQDPREQILAYYNTVGDGDADVDVKTETEAVKVQRNAVNPPELLRPTKTTSASVFTVWRPCSNDAIQKMMEGQGVGKGLDIKGKSAKAGCLSGFVPYLQIHKEADKSKVKTLERGGRTRIFFASKAARDQVMEELGPLQNQILNVVQDAKRTVKRNVVSVFAAGRSSTMAAKKTFLSSARSVSSTGSSVLSSVGENLSSIVTTSDGAMVLNDDTAADNSKNSALVTRDKSNQRIETFQSIGKSATNGIAKSAIVATTTVASTAAIITSPLSAGMQSGASMASNTLSSVGQLATGTVNDLSHHAAKIVSPVSDGLRRGAAMTTSTASALHQLSSEAVTGLSVNVIDSARTNLEFATAATSVIARPVHKTIKDISIKGLGLGGGKDGDEVDWALKRLLWDMDDPSIRPVDGYEDCYGIELPDRLLWQAFVVDRDISRTEDSKWYNARPSQPAFQDMNFIAISKSRKHRKKHPKSNDPLVVLWQTCTGEDDDNDPMDPRGLVMAYEECGRVLPVVSDFDCFTMGSKSVSYERLPDEQLELLNWCISSIEEILQKDAQSTNASWTDRWLEILKSNATKGFHPEIPKYGFGDAKSYDIVEEAVSFLQDSGAVRHGAECFNFYFPQELDDQFLIVSDAFPDRWRYVNVCELQDFLTDRIDEGFTFPLNPKWVLIDDARWMKLYNRLLASDEKCVKESMDAWFPSEIRERIDSIRKSHPDGFMGKRSVEDPEEAADLALLSLERQMIFRRARAKLFSALMMLSLFLDVRRRRVLLECEENSEEEESQVGMVDEGVNDTAMDEQQDGGSTAWAIVYR